MSATALLEPTPSVGQSPANDVLYEVVNGRQVEKPPLSAYENRLASKLVRHLEEFGDTRQLGRAVCETLFVLEAEDRLRRKPDVAFVSFLRWPKHQRVPRTPAWDVIPELAVEAISPADLAEEIAQRIHEYFQKDVKQVWVIYPTVELVYVCESPTRVRILTREDDLDGGAILPGFRLPLAWLFESGTASDQP
jgi:Uma2 family endonuclease